MKTIYKNPNRNNKKSKRFSSLTICLLLLVVFAISGTVAYIFTQTDAVENNFIPPLYEADIDEPNWDGKIKENVSVKVIGDTEVYVRAAVLVSWKDEAGNVLSIEPVKDNDYTLELSKSENWFADAEGFFYYKLPVQGTEEGTATDILIEKCEWIARAPKDGYMLVVDVLSQIVQATPKDAVESAWGVTVNADRTISK